MRTTVDIDDQLLLYAKHQAVQQGCTFKQIFISVSIFSPTQELIEP
jgi:hypothetical protein